MPFIPLQKRTFKGFCPSFYRFIGSLCLVVALPAGLWAQNSQVDSLQQLLTKAGQDTNRVNILNDLLKLQATTFSEGQIDSLARESIALSQQLSYAKGQVVALLRQALSLILRGNYALAKKYYDRALAVAEKDPDLTLRLRCYNDLGAYHGELSEYPEAIRYFTRSVGLGEKLGNRQAVLFGYHSMANISMDLKLYEEALKYCLKGEEILKDHPDGLYILWENTARAYTELALETQQRSRRDSCVRRGLAYARKGLMAARAAGNDAFTASFYLTLGNYYASLEKNYAKALDRLQKGLHYARKAEYENIIASLMLATARVHKDKREFARALPIALEALKKYEQTGARAYIAQTERLLGEIYHGAGNAPQAYRYASKGAARQDTLQQEERTKQVASLQAQFAFDRKEFEIRQLQQANEMQRVKNAQQATVRNGLIAIAALLFLLSGVLYNRFRLKQRTNLALEAKQREINQRNGQLQTSLEEKDVLLKEVHHRVKNNLQLMSSLLSLQQQATQEPLIAEAIQESQSRVKSIALIHEKLYRSQTLSRIDFKEYAGELVASLVHSFRGQQPITYCIESEPVLLDVDTAVRLGLVINELVCNVLKHAFPGNQAGQIRIGLTQPQAHTYELQVSDTGVGLPEIPDIETAPSLGLRLVKAITRQLNGSLGIHNGLGTTFTLRFSELQPI